MNNSNERSGKKPYVQPAITAVINLKEKYGINDMGVGGASQTVNADSSNGNVAAPKSDLIFGDDAESVTKTSTHSVWDDTGVWDDDISMK